MFQGTMYYIGCTLAPTDEYDGMIRGLAAMRAVAAVAEPTELSRTHSGNWNVHELQVEQTVSVCSELSGDLDRLQCSV